MNYMIAQKDELIFMWFKLASVNSYRFVRWMGDEFSVDGEFQEYMACMGYHMGAVDWGDQLNGGPIDFGDQLTGESVDLGASWRRQFLLRSWNYFDP